jgi:hypothetical protein
MLEKLARKGGDFAARVGETLDADAPPRSTRRPFPTRQHVVPVAPLGKAVWRCLNTNPTSRPPGRCR